MDGSRIIAKATTYPWKDNDMGTDSSIGCASFGRFMMIRFRLMMRKHCERHIHLYIIIYPLQIQSSAMFTIHP
jgi:hypothetical protein